MSAVFAFIRALRAVISVMQVVLLFRVLCEFKAVPRNSGPFQFIQMISDPLLDPVRKILAKQAKEKNLRFDISPLVVIILLNLVSTLLKRYIS